jgi:Zn-dependent protease with chaperone function
MTPCPTDAGVEVDVCGDCGSVFFNRGEILIFAKPMHAFAQAIEEARTRKQDSPHAAPSGGQLWTIRLPVAGTPAFLDPRSGGVWMRRSALRMLEGRKALTLGLRSPAARTERSPLNLGAPPNLWLRSMGTLFGLYALLVGVLITASLFLGLSPLAALVLGAVALAVQYAVSPWLMDLVMSWLYQVQWTDVSELPEHLQAFVERACRAQRMKVPHFGMIWDLAPNAFTYGHHPNNARLVLTRGMLELLEPLELESVVGHEIGHARHWDMALMTLAQLVPLVFYYIYRLLMRAGDEAEANGASLALASGAYLLYFLSEYVVLWFSRTREYHADRFGARVAGSAAALAKALVKVAYGLAGQTEESPERSRRALSLGAMGIFDPGSASSFAVAAYSAGTKPGEEEEGGLPTSNERYRLDPDTVKGAMKWDLWNPWARWYELQSTHPLTARRILHLSALSVEMGEEPFVVFDLQKPGSMCDEFLFEAIVSVLPSATLLLGLAMVGASALGGLTFTAWGPLAIVLGLAMIVKLRFRYPTRSFPDMSVATLLRQVRVSDVRPVPCRLEGTIRGRGVPGLIWSDDFVMQDETGILFLDHRQPLAIWEWLWGWMRAGDLIGNEIVVEGWFRRAPIPYVEIHRFTVDGETRRSYFRHPQWLFAVALIGLGIYLRLIGF